MEEGKTQRSRLKILRTKDPQSMFPHFTAKEIYKKLGPPRSLLSRSAKSEKSRKVKVLSRILYLTPGVYCPRATDSCLQVCLGHTSGRMTMLTSANARDRRTALYAAEPQFFLQLLRSELLLLQAEAKQQHLVPAVRLNGSSDLPWEQLHGELFEEFEGIQFYDYTKLASRVRSFLGGASRQGSWPANYHLTYSLSERNVAEARALLKAGANVAVVFWPEVPSRWQGIPVLDGDRHDARFRDPRGSRQGQGVLVGLSAKGIAREDLSGFVVRTADASAGKQSLNAA